MEHVSAQSLDRVALQATIHCLTGCAIGEILGLVIATTLGWHDLPSIAVAIALAFAFGYGLAIRPLPVNRWLISRGLGHAVLHAQHG